MTAEGWNTPRDVPMDIWLDDSRARFPRKCRDHELLITEHSVLGP